jgi:hypothetical protein
MELLILNLILVISLKEQTKRVRCYFGRLKWKRLDESTPADLQRSWMSIEEETASYYTDCIIIAEREHAIK